MKRIRGSCWIRAVTVAVVAAFVTGILAGCFGGVSESISFSTASLKLAVGETQDLASLIVTNPSSASYTLTVSDESVLALDGTELTAVAYGSAVVAATTDAGKTAKLSVTVRYASLVGITIETQGNLSQREGATEPVTFTVRLTDGADPTLAAWTTWTVDDRFKGTGASFTTTPTASGTYMIGASVRSGGKTYSATAELTVSEAPAVSAYCDDESALYQSGSFEPVSFHVSGRGVETLPEVIWYIDGEWAGTGASFDYTPASYGTFEVTVTADGETLMFADGSASKRIVAARGILLRNLTVETDNLYPDIVVAWDDPGEEIVVGVKITLPDGTETEYRSDDSRDAERFGANCFNAKGLFELTAAAPSTVSIAVRSLGASGELPEPYGEAVSVRQLPSVAETYLSQRFWTYDYVITSPEEFGKIMDFMLRQNVTETSSIRPETKTFRFYIGYTWKTGNVGISEYANNTIFGSYTTVSGLSFSDSVSIDANGVCTFRIEYGTVNSPSCQTGNATGDNARITEANYIKPHINYPDDGYEDRTEAHVFAIDERTATQTVTSSDELFYAVENGARPVCTTGSNAEKIYAYARTLLMRILSDDMTDFEKAHAIYDWILWRVRYDWNALTVSERLSGSAAIANDSRYSSYYLEAVLTDGATVCTDENGEFYLPYAVCDGMSKAYSLLCNMEGIPCKRVGGYAGDFGTDGIFNTADDGSVGGHAWDKVLLGGEWYVVDPTWGDTAMRTQDSIIELATHTYLFLTDEQIASTHEEEGAPLPAAETEYDVYRQMTVTLNGRTETLRIDGKTDLASKLRFYYEYLAALAGTSGDNEAIVPGNATDAPTTYQKACIEILADTESVPSIEAAVERLIPSNEEYLFLSIETDMGTTVIYFGLNVAA